MPSRAAGQLVAERGPAVAHALDQPFRSERLQYGESDRARQRGAVPRVPQREPPGPAGDGVVHLLVAQDRADRRVPRAEALRRRDDVRPARGRVPGEPVPGAADAGDDLVEADQEPVAVAPLGQALPETLGRRVRGEGGGADRLAEVRRHVLRPGGLERAVERVQGGLARGVEPPRARRNVRVLAQVGAERSLQPGPPRERERLHRRPVVGLGGRDHLPPLRLAALHVVAAGQLDRHLVRVRAARDEPDPAESLRRDLHQLAGQLLLRRVGEPFVVHVGEPVGLGLRGGGDVLPAVAERRRHRAAAHGVQVAAPRVVLDPCALAPHRDGVPDLELQGQDVRFAALDHRA